MVIFITFILLLLYFRVSFCFHFKVSKCIVSVLIDVNHVQCVNYPVSRPVCCILLCGCDTTPSADCCFSINLTLKSCSFVSLCEGTPEGTLFQNHCGKAWWTLCATPPADSVNSPKIGPSA